MEFAIVIHKNLKWSHFEKNKDVLSDGVLFFGVYFFA